MDEPWTPPDIDIVDTAEIARRCHVAPVTARMWMTRNQLPTPDGYIGRSPWWHWQRVTALSPMVARCLATARLAAENTEVTP